MWSTLDGTVQCLAGEAWGSPSACHVPMVLLRLRAGCEYSDEVFFYPNLKAGQHNLIPEHRGDPSV